jgi:chemotaxis protein methyltransferase CheR
MQHYYRAFQRILIITLQATQKPVNYYNAYNSMRNAFVLNDGQIAILLKDLELIHGYDFNYYSRDSIRRRVSKIFRLEKFSSFEEFRTRIASDPGYIEHLVDRLTVNVTQMFRDSEFFLELRRKILPSLSALPQIRIWHAGCSTGEEVYSMAILLHEAGLLEKARIFATDINPLALEKAKAGAYALSLLQMYGRNYQASGGERNFQSYYIANKAHGDIARFLKDRVTFSAHNLASGLYINKFNLILCRNVVIYFDKELRERVFGLFDLSLLPQGHLALGEKETLNFSSIASGYVQESKEKIWKKIK